ncbi:hypothetical protein JW851_05190 [Candidatus Woesearchaeota archaeon]|nr:hypothetical protein [Candidatus Woesearchaeota archaeon]
MKIEITETKDNPLLSRKGVKGILTFNTATPSNDILQGSLAKQLNVDKQVIMIKRIKTHFGSSKADFLAYVYNSEDELKRIEPAPVKWVEKQEKKAAAKKKAEEQEKPVEKKETPAETATEETKTEEKKEAAK